MGPTVQTLLDRYVLAGGFMMAFLVPLAFLMVAFAVQGLVNLRRGRLCPPDSVDRLRALARGAADPEAAARRLLDAAPTSFSRVVHATAQRLARNPGADPAEVLRSEIEEEAAALRQQNGQLGLVYNIAPLLGLLGTVFGMLQAFAEFSRSPNPSIADLSASINLALLTTAWGLSIAIPAFVVLFGFTRRIGRFERVVLPRAGARALEVLLGVPPGEPAAPDEPAAP